MPVLTLDLMNLSGPTTSNNQHLASSQIPESSHWNSNTCASPVSYFDRKCTSSEISSSSLPSLLSSCKMLLTGMTWCYGCGSFPKDVSPAVLVKFSQILESTSPDNPLKAAACAPFPCPVNFLLLCFDTASVSSQPFQQCGSPFGGCWQSSSGQLTNQQ